MDTALKNMRWEAFCQLYSGACFGNAARALIEAGYKARSVQVASVDASKLLANSSIQARIAHLRHQRGKELAIDQTRIMELRLQVVYNPDSSDADKLRALDSIEKALGLANPDRIEHSMTNGATIRFITTEEPTVQAVIATPITAPAPEVVLVTKPAFPPKKDSMDIGIF